MQAVNERIDLETSRARDLANVGAPPLAMLAAALVLALTLGFGASLFIELKRPTIADSREAEQVTRSESAQRHRARGVYAGAGQEAG